MVKRVAARSKIARTLYYGFMTSSALVMGAGFIYLIAPRPSNLDLQNIETRHVSSIEEPPRSNALTPELKTLGPIDLSNLILEKALTSFKSGDFGAVRTAQNSMAKGSVDYQLVEWLLATSGSGAVSAGDIRSAQKMLSDWPSQTTIARNLERAMAKNPLSVAQMRLTKSDAPPQSFQGAYAIARTYLLTGNEKAARALLVPFWHVEALSQSDEKAVIEHFKDVLTPRDHEIRFFNMMVRERISSADIIAEAMNWQSLHKAWSSVIRKQKQAPKLMEDLSETDKKTAAYAFMRVEYLRRQEQDDEAIKIISALPADADYLINPDLWWNERRIISRHKFEQGDAETAFMLAQAQMGGDEETQIDAAFHAGWYALRGLKDKAKAAPYFQKITEIAKGDISLSRGYYWLARASDDELTAKQHFEKAATFSKTYYGLLAAEALGKAPALPGLPQTTDVAPLPAPVQALDRLIAVKETQIARNLYLALAWHLNDPAQLRLVSEHAQRHADYYAALKVAKTADWRGINVGLLTHPLGAISNATGLEPQDHALAYAVARQESEFNVGAVSSAKAQGLLQVLPATAKQMAQKIGLAYAPEKLTRDANYNARIGTAYLDSQLAAFDGSYILTFVAYNAGPRRAKEWIERFGDPRGQSLDEIIDWVEKIPYPETRNYVQRLIENLQVYKMQLGQSASISNDLQFGKR